MSQLILHSAIRPDGVSLGVQIPTQKKREVAPRGKTQGWNFTIASRWIKFLQSINCDKLGSDNATSFTLTLGSLEHYPKTFKQYQRARDNFFRDIRRQQGHIRTLWLSEFQARGAIHLHGCCWGVSPEVVERLWLHHFKIHGSRAEGQFCVSMPTIDLWRMYLAKHCSRGLAHYQRQYKKFSEGWAVSGRMYGYFGRWDGILENYRESVENPTIRDYKLHYSFRRMLRNKNLSQLQFNLRCLEDNGGGWTRVCCLWLRRRITRLKRHHVCRVDFTDDKGNKNIEKIKRISACRGITSWIRQIDTWRFIMGWNDTHQIIN